MDDPVTEALKDDPMPIGKPNTSPPKPITEGDDPATALVKKLSASLASELRLMPNAFEDIDDIDFTRYVFTKLQASHEEATTPTSKVAALREMRLAAEQMLKFKAADGRNKALGDVSMSWLRKMPEAEAEDDYEPLEVLDGDVSAASG